jgi:hypothetical protein
MILRDGVLALLRFVANKGRLLNRSQLSCPHMRALADIIDSDAEWVAKKDEYDQMAEKLSEEEFWRPEYIYFAENNRTIFFLPKWDFHHDRAFTEEYFSIDEAFPSEGEAEALGIVHCWDGYILLLDDASASSKVSRPASPKQVEEYKKLLIQKGMSEKPEILALVPDKRLLD